MDPILASALQSWDLSHPVIWLIPLTLLVYTRGFARVHAQNPVSYPTWRLVSFTGGLLAVFLAIASPLDALGELLLHLHMTQHMLLMMVAPPLLLLGQPVVPMLRAFPPKLMRRALGRLLTSHVLRAAGRACVSRTVGWCALAAAMLVWHVPRLYELGLQSEGWHEVQHGCFFTAAMLFWWPVIGVWPDRVASPRWTLIPYLVTADLVNTALSAILTFSNTCCIRRMRARRV